MKHLSIFFLFVVFLLPTELRAQSSSLCVAVETTGSERIEYLLSDVPRIVYDAAKVTITTMKASVDFNPAEVQKVYIAESTSPSAVKEIRQPDGTFQLQHEQVRFSGFASNESVALFGVDGRQLWCRRVDAGGNLVVSLGQLSAGIYIIKTSHQSFKITKK